MESRDSNRRIVAGFYAQVLGARDRDYVLQHVAEAYVQHSPQLKSGRAGLLEALEMLWQMPPAPDAPPPRLFLLADGPYVATHMWLSFAGQARLVMDLFRLENGKMVEHWDATMAASSGANMPWAGTIDQRADGTANKALVRAFTEQVRLRRDFAASPEYLSQALLETAAFQAQLREVEVHQVHRLIGEGDFVLSQAQGLREGGEVVLYDLYRLQDGRIAAHWQVAQALVACPLHGNGMI